MWVGVGCDVLGLNIYTVVSGLALDLALRLTELPQAKST